MNVARSTVALTIGSAVTILLCSVLRRGCGIELSTEETGALQLVVAALLGHYVSDETPTAPPMRDNP